MPVSISSRNNYSINSANQITFKDDNILDKIVIQNQGVLTLGNTGLVVSQLSIASQGVKVSSGFFAMSFDNDKILTGHFENEANVTEFQTVSQVQSTTTNSFPITNYADISVGTNILVCIRYNLLSNADVDPTIVCVVGTVGNDPNITNNANSNEIYYLPIARIVKAGAVILDAHIVQSGTTNDSSAQAIYPLANISGGGGGGGGTQDAVQLTSQNGVVNWDLSDGNYFHLLLTENTRLNNPENIPTQLTKKSIVILEVTQDSTGGFDFNEFGETIIDTNGINLILHQSGNTIRFTVDGGDLSNVAVGQQVIITGAGNGKNNGVFLVVNTDNSTFIEINNPNRTDNADDAINSTATYKVIKSVFVPETNGLTNINLGGVLPNQKNYLQFGVRGDGKLDLFTNRPFGFETVDGANNQIFLNT